MSQRLTRREREKLERRRQMLEAALHLFAERGFHNVAMREIAEHAEFALGTLYKFFENKEDLYKALLLDRAAAYHRALTNVLTTEKDTRTTLHDFIVAKGDFFNDDVAILRLYFAESRGASFNIKAGLDQDIRKFYDHLVRHIASVLKAGIDRGEIRDVEPYSLAVALEGLSNAFLFSWLENPQQHPYQEQVDTILDIFLQGVQA